MKLFATLGVLLAATIGSASAAMITYNTSGTNFSCSSPACSVNNASVGPFGVSPVITFTQGADVATLTYVGPGPGPANASVSTPTNLNYGFLTFSCTACATGSIAIPSFTLNLVLNDVTDSGSTTFVGTSSAGTVTTSSNPISIFWSPTSATFGPTNFFIENFTPLPSDNTTLGQVTIRGTITTTNSAPEPGSMFLLGAGLIGVGFTARKKFASRS